VAGLPLNDDFAFSYEAAKVKPIRWRPAAALLADALAAPRQRSVQDDHSLAQPAPSGAVYCNKTCSDFISGSGRATNILIVEAKTKAPTNPRKKNTLKVAILINPH
jgi:hypothetical protein